MAKKLKLVSKEWSLKGWELITFLIKRKKTIITILATALAWFLSDSALIALITGPVAEGLFSIIEYAWKEHYE